MQREPCVRKAVLIATGAEYRRLEAEGREEFEGSGVYYAATALEGQLCRGATVIVAGAGNSAGQACDVSVGRARPKSCLSLEETTSAKACRAILTRRVETTANIEILYRTEIRKMRGGKMLEAVELENVESRRAPHGRNSGRLFR